MDVLFNALPGAALAVVLLFLGTWESDRRTRRTEARKTAAADRAALEAQADEFVAAVMAVTTAGVVHDAMWGGWKTRAVVLIQALAQGVSAYAGAASGKAFSAANEAAHVVISEWDRGSAKSAQELAAPLARLGSAGAPLMRRQEPGLADAANEVVVSIRENYADAERISSSLSVFREALGSALEPPAPSRRRWFRRRGADQIVETSG
ncbi:hypothetical protein AB4225_29445 [Streptomyces sp. 2RAF24]|uniref:hypothetical protein n=1 Tax=Streptomyces sp. 2RAF24 TaxID=3232997 RepID=UPI003F9ADC6C